MNGTLILERHSLRNSIPPLLGAVILSAAIMAAITRQMPLSGARLGMVAAGLTYLCFRLLYPMLSELLPGGGQEEASWEVTRDVLVLDREILPRSHIHRIHVWPNRDALGHRLPGWTVNLEMNGDNILLRSLRHGAAEEASTKAIEELIHALGCELPAE